MERMGDGIDVSVGIVEDSSSASIVAGWAGIGWATILSERAVFPTFGCLPGCVETHLLRYSQAE